jgi:hypothetical protein
LHAKQERAAARLAGIRDHVVVLRRHARREKSALASDSAASTFRAHDTGIRVRVNFVEQAIVEDRFDEASAETERLFPWRGLAARGAYRRRRGHSLCGVRMCVVQ